MQWCKNEEHMSIKVRTVFILFKVEKMGASDKEEQNSHEYPQTVFMNELLRILWLVVGWYSSIKINTTVKNPTSGKNCSKCVPCVCMTRCAEDHKQPSSELHHSFLPFMQTLAVI